MSDGGKRQGSGTALWALVLVAGVLAAEVLTELGRNGFVYLAFRQTYEFELFKATFQAFQVFYVVTPAILAIALWKASRLTTRRAPWLVASAATATSSLIGLFWLIAFISDFRFDHQSLLEAVGWLWLASAIVSKAGLFWGCSLAAGRAVYGFVALAGVLLAVRLIAPKIASEFLLRSALGQGVSLAIDVLAAVATILVVLKTLTKYELGAAGSWSECRRGLLRYRDALIWRVVLVALPLLFIFMRSPSALVPMMSILGVAVTLVAIHAARGLYGLSRAPVASGASLAATTAFVLMLGVLVFHGMSLTLLPDLFSGVENDSFGGSNLAEAAASLALLSMLANGLGFVALFGILRALHKIARHLNDEELVRSVRLVAVLLVASVGATGYLYLVASQITIRMPMGVVGGLLVLVLALATLVRYIRLLKEAAETIELAEGHAPPRAVVSKLGDLG